MDATFSSWMNSVAHLCFICISMSDATLTDCPSTAICCTVPKRDGIMEGWFHKRRPYSRWPWTSDTTKKEELLDRLIHANLWISTRELFTELSISFKVLEMMLATLEYHRVYTRWVPQMITQEQKDHYMQVFQDHLNHYKAEGDSFLDHIIIGDETWCHLYKLESKQQSKCRDMWIPHQRKGSRCSPQQVKWCALSSRIKKKWSFWISWNPY